MSNGIVGTPRHARDGWGRILAAARMAHASHASRGRGVLRRGVGAILAAAMLAGCGARPAQQAGPSKRAAPPPAAGAASPPAAAVSPPSPSGGGAKPQAPDAVVQAYLRDLLRTPFQFRNAYALLTPASQKTVPAADPWGAVGLLPAGGSACVAAAQQVERILLLEFWTAAAHRTRWRISPARVAAGVATVRVSVSQPNMSGHNNFGLSGSAPSASGQGAAQPGSNQQIINQAMAKAFPTAADRQALARMKSACSQGQQPSAQGQQPSSQAALGAAFSLLFLPLMIQAVSSGKVPQASRTVDFRLQRSASGAWRIALPAGTKAMLPGELPSSGGAAGSPSGSGPQGPVQGG